jgi:hypothetical protein
MTDKLDNMMHILEHYQLKYQILTMPGLEPLRALTNLRKLNCKNNPLNQAEINKFKKAVSNCRVI